MMRAFALITLLRSSYGIRGTQTAGCLPWEMPFCKAPVLPQQSLRPSSSSSDLPLNVATASLIAALSKHSKPSVRFALNSSGFVGGPPFMLITNPSEVEHRGSRWLAIRLGTNGYCNMRYLNLTSHGSSLFVRTAKVLPPSSSVPMVPGESAEGQLDLAFVGTVIVRDGVPTHVFYGAEDSRLFVQGGELWLLGAMLNEQMALARIPPDEIGPASDGRLRNATATLVYLRPPFDPHHPTLHRVEKNWVHVPEPTADEAVGSPPATGARTTLLLARQICPFAILRCNASSGACISAYVHRYACSPRMHGGSPLVEVPAPAASGAEQRDHAAAQGANVYGAPTMLVGAMHSRSHGMALAMAATHTLVDRVYFHMLYRVESHAPYRVLNVSSARDCFSLLLSASDCR